MTNIYWIGNEDVDIGSSVLGIIVLNGIPHGVIYDEDFMQFIMLKTLVGRPQEVIRL